MLNTLMSQHKMRIKLSKQYFVIFQKRIAARCNKLLKFSRLCHVLIEKRFR